MCARACSSARQSRRLSSPQREEIAQIAQAEIAKVQMMNKVTAKLEALAVKERERKKVEQCCAYRALAHLPRY